MKIFEPIKIKSTGAVVGYFYKLLEDGRMLYVSFGAYVNAVDADKVEAATQDELNATKEEQRRSGHRGVLPEEPINVKESPIYH